MEAILLNLMLIVPAAAAVLIWMLPESNERVAPRLAFWAGLIAGVIGLSLWYLTPGAGLAAETSATWIAIDAATGGAGGAAGSGGVIVRYHVALDAISAPLVGLTGLLVPIAIACSFTAIRTRVREYYAWMLLLATGMLGVFVARDMLLFYVFFEFTLIPMYFLVGIWGGEQRRWAANKFFLYTFAGSVITFAGILYLALRAAHGGAVDFSFTRLMGATGLSLTEQSVLFVGFFCGFAIKVPLFPLHTWLPLAHTEAPTAGSVILAGVLLKLGTYGFLRFSLPLVPEGAVMWAQVMGGLAVAGIIYGALCSWVQRDVKKLVAYSSVSHLGFCMLGMFSLLPVGLSGSVLYMVNHGLSTGALFMLVGMMYERYHTRDMEKLGGLARRMPIFATFLMFFTLSSIGLPGLNGFISEFTTLLAAFNSPVLGPGFGAVGALGILLGAIYMLYMVGKVLFGPLREPAHTPDLSAGLRRDLTAREVGALVPLAVACVVLGVAPRVVTDPLDPVLQTEVVQRVQNTESYKAIVAAAAGPARVTSNAGPESPVFGLESVSATGER